MRGRAIGSPRCASGVVSWLFLRFLGFVFGFFPAVGSFELIGVGIGQFGYAGVVLGNKRLGIGFVLDIKQEFGEFGFGGGQLV